MKSKSISFAHPFYVKSKECVNTDYFLFITGELVLAAPRLPCMLVLKGLITSLMVTIHQLRITGKYASVSNLLGMLQTTT